MLVFPKKRALLVLGGMEIDLSTGDIRTWPELDVASMFEKLLEGLNPFLPTI